MTAPPEPGPVGIVHSVAGNAAAFRFVLSCLEAEGVPVGRVWSLGNLIGRGRQSAACVELARGLAGALVGPWERRVLAGVPEAPLGLGARAAWERLRRTVAHSSLESLGLIDRAVVVEGGVTLAAGPSLEALVPDGALFFGTWRREGAPPPGMPPRLLAGGLDAPFVFRVGREAEPLAEDRDVEVAWEPGPAAVAVGGVGYSRRFLAGWAGYAVLEPGIVRLRARPFTFDPRDYDL